MARKKQALTPAAIDNLKIGALQDLLTPGLSIEVATSGGKVWKYYRRLPPGRGFLRRVLGPFPANNIADARAWAGAFNGQIEAGIDPRAGERAEAAERRAREEAQQAEALRATMTVSRAHGIYMEAVRQGRASRAKRRNKPRTIQDKLYIYSLDIGPALGSRVVYDVSEADLVALVQARGTTAPVRANRLAAELKVFFGWAASLRGSEVGLDVDPSRRLGDLRFPEEPRARILSLFEIEVFLRALVHAERVFRRGFIICLLTAARISEVIEARTTEIVDGV